MSIIRFPGKNNKQKQYKHLNKKPFNIDNHLREFAEEVKKNAKYISEQNAVYQSFKKKMEQAKKK